MAKAKVKIAKAKTGPIGPEIPSANTAPMSGATIGSRMVKPNPSLASKGPASNAQVTANLTPSQAVEVAEMQAETSPDENIYDESIGYGKAKKTADGKWAETGTAAVARIKRAKVKRKGN